MGSPVSANEQLILEIYVRDLRSSLVFYQKLGFKIHRQEAGFAELAWEDSWLYLVLRLAGLYAGRAGWHRDTIRNRTARQR